jgi:hypothetical protein
MIQTSLRIWHRNLNYRKKPTLQVDHSFCHDCYMNTTILDVIEQIFVSLPSPRALTYTWGCIDDVNYNRFLSTGGYPSVLALKMSPSPPNMIFFR